MLDNSILVALKKYKQEHLLAHYKELDSVGREKLASQISAINWDVIAELKERYLSSNVQHASLPERLEPAPYFPLTPCNSEMKKHYLKAEAIGRTLLMAGKVSALTVAGGQGTRLGYDAPKGTCPITPIKKKSFFQYFAESLLRVGEKYGKPVSWYIMTSEMNNVATVEFFEENNFFGLAHDSVIFFVQGTMPVIGYDGKLLLGSKESIALAPDGHGGTLLALRKSGALDRMKSEGVEYISYFQVDNPIVSVVDPLFIGLHHLEGAEMSARMITKTDSFEKLGNFCIADGKLTIIEYSDMPNELAEARQVDGSLRFIAGSPAIHMISCSFIERLTADGRLELPWHRADKKVSFLDAFGEKVTPDDANAMKLETFIFDALGLAAKTILLEALREDEFAPAKNKTGVDSLESCRAMLASRDARRLMSAGLQIPLREGGAPDCTIEISPALILDDDDAVEYLKQHKHLSPKKGEEFYLG